MRTASGKRPSARWAAVCCLVLAQALPLLPSVSFASARPAGVVSSRAAAGTSLSVNPYAAPANSTVELFGEGYTPGARITFTFGGAPVAGLSAIANASGFFTDTLLVVPNKPDGVYTIVSSDGHNGAAFQFAVAAMTPHQAGEAGVNYMAQEAWRWTQSSSCISCHITGNTLIGVSLAVSLGYTLTQTSTTSFQNLLNTVVQYQNSNPYTSTSFGPGSFPFHAPLGDALSRYVSAGLAYYDQNASKTLEQSTFLPAAAHIASTQITATTNITMAGSWPDDYGGYPGPLLSGTPYMGTWQGIITLQEAYTDTGNAAYAAQVRQAVQWLRANPPGNPVKAGVYDADSAISAPDQWLYSDQGLALLGFIAAGAEQDPVAQQLIQTIEKEQNADGGWAGGPTGANDGFLGDSPDGSSNAYNTGMMVYALYEAGAPLGSPALAAGTRWLIDNQDANLNETMNEYGGYGSWPDGSFASPNTYSTSSGMHTRIASTMWPVVALVVAQVQAPPQLPTPTPSPTTKPLPVATPRPAPTSSPTATRMPFTATPMPPATATLAPRPATHPLPTTGGFPHFPGGPGGQLGLVGVLLAGLALWLRRITRARRARRAPRT